MYSKILNKKVWAVAGATQNLHKFGGRIYQRLKKEGYVVYGINPGLELIFGDKCYKRLQDLPETPDIVDVVVPTKAAMDIARQAAESGVKLFWVQPGADTTEVVDYAESLGLDVIKGCVLSELNKKRV